MCIRTGLILCVFLASLAVANAQEQDLLFANSYALVIGVDDYGSSDWPDLDYAVKDANGFADFLEEQGFVVRRLRNGEATKTAILSAVEDYLLPRLAAEDRVLVFFAGHGATRVVGGAERGYLVPADATSSFGSMIPVTQLHDISEAMGVAKHQLFILDSCFGGLAAMRSSAANTTIDPRMPNYLFEVTRRRARQLLTAGGANQQVQDGGPDGHSLFTGHLLRALREGIGDNNGDGYITFSELFSYIQVAASTFNQTPGNDVFAGHEQGDFVFLRTGNGGRANIPVTPAPASTTVDVYETLASAKRAFLASDYFGARRLFMQAAELGNAEAMVFLGKLTWEGLGGPVDKEASLGWLTGAAERGHTGAMRSLIAIYSEDGPAHNASEAARWQRALEEAEALQASLDIVDPSGQAGRDEPQIPAAATDVRPVPQPPTSFSIQ